ncbi:family 16 glycosylhydrolase [Shewanella submarina]|uniref:PKD domain-containing protein n=1 Tax=Shewanella submarina TaxID=2016376 RepID=A0ABV7GAJ8_9GAMM|nr:PKD domain-containing protein [Shewanella submarina]MCL1038540.1 family 16 glycosylhydrolase [Shewanella submarina]
MINTRYKLAGLAVLAAVSTQLQAEQCQQLVWSDDFNGNSLDTNSWEAMLGDGCAEGICGWGNNEEQWYLAENATVSNGVLSITAKQQRNRGSKYSSARLRTANMPGSGEWLHGRFEAKIKLPAGQGLWPAFWMLPTDPAEGWPMSGEIDIVESTGQASMFAHGTIHYGEPWPNNAFSGGHILSQPGPWSDDFHTFAVEWEPGEMRWYLDDLLYSVKTPDDIGNAAWWRFDENNFHLILNLAVGGTWGGTPDDSIFPVSMEVDHVRVFDSGQPYLIGSNIVSANEVVSFEVAGETGTGGQYQWQVPQGAVISGSGSRVDIDFSNAQSGDVSVSVTNSCGTRQLTTGVFVEPQLPTKTMLDDFDQQRVLNYTSSNGDFSIQNGTLVYTRDGASQYDVIAADTNAISGVEQLITGDSAFTIDVNNTDSSLVGKTLLIQLEDSSVATPDNYPNGRHSKYEAQVEHANGWQTLRFRLTDRIDSLVGHDQVNSFILLIDPNAFTADTYVIDNIKQLGQSGENQAPVANFTSDCNGLGCSFDASSSSDSDGSVTGFQWEFGDGATGSGINASHNYSAAGSYQVTLTVTDDQGASAQITQNVTVTDPDAVADSIYVSNVVTEAIGAGGGQKFGQSQVTVLNNLQQPIVGVTVAGNFSGSWNESQIATTDANGVAVLTTSSSLKGKVSVQFCVASISGASLPLDEGSSQSLCN